MGGWVNIFLEGCVQPESESKTGRLKWKVEMTKDLVKPKLGQKIA